MPITSILFVILVDEVMIITGLIGALVESSYKWGFFTIGCVALLYVVYVLAFEARSHARSLGNDISGVYLRCGALTALLWTLYPIAWGLSEGGNVIAPDSEAVFYGVLDLLAKPVFGALLIHGHRNIAPHRLGLRIRGKLLVALDAMTITNSATDVTEDPQLHGSHHGEKHGHHNGVAASNGVSATGTNGVHNNGVVGTNGTTNGTGAIHGVNHHTATDVNPNTPAHV